MRTRMETGRTDGVVALTAVASLVICRSPPERGTQTRTGFAAAPWRQHHLRLRISLSLPDPLLSWPATIRRYVLRSYQFFARGQGALESIGSRHAHVFYSNDSGQPDCSRPGLHCPCG